MRTDTTITDEWTINVRWQRNHIYAPWQVSPIELVLPGHDCAKQRPGRHRYHVPNLSIRKRCSSNRTVSQTFYYLQLKKKLKKSPPQMKQSLASDNTVSSLNTFWLGVWIYFSTFYTNGNIGERGPLSSAVSPIWYILCSGSVQRQQAAAAAAEWLTDSLLVKLIGGALRLPDLTHTW